MGNMARLAISLFGRLNLARGDDKLAVPGRKLQALLVYLARNVDRPPPREQLAALLWGDRHDDQARQSLRQCVSRLRKILVDGDAPVLLSNGDHVGLNAEFVDIDTRAFERHARDRSPEALARAAALYRGTLAEGLHVGEAPFDEWIAAERAYFRNAACEALLRLAVQRAETGKTALAIETGRRLVSLDPLCEEGHRLLMRAYAAGGQRAAALRQYQSCAALLLGELGTEPDTITKRLHKEIQSAGADSAEPVFPTPHADKPVIAVLPFADISSKKDQDYFANGMTEDIITALTKYRWLSVIARNATAAYKGQAPDVRQVADDLDANYVVTGSIRKVGNRLRVNAQLIDAQVGNHIWAERYDHALKDIFAIQDEITETIAATIEPELAAVESQRAGRKPTENLDAWDCYHLGLSHLYKFSKESNLEAQRLFRRAIEIDPGFGAAHARLAYAIIMSAVYFEAAPTPGLLDDALEVAKRAALFDNRDAIAHFALGRAHLARGEYDLSIAELKTAIDLNPCLAQAHCGLGDSLAYSGRLDESVSSFNEAVRLSPNDPYRWGFLMYGSLARLFMKENESAAEWALNAVRVPNAHYWANAALVAALGYLDRPDETRAAVAELLRRKPEFTCRFARDHLFYVKDQAQVDYYVAGLRKAGIPE